MCRSQGASTRQHKKTLVRGTIGKDDTWCFFLPCRGFFNLVPLSFQAGGEQCL